MAKHPVDEPDVEISAMLAVYEALRSLNPDSQERVLNYVRGRFGLGVGNEPAPEESLRRPPRQVVIEEEPNNEPPEPPGRKPDASPSPDSGFNEGLSPVALKWMTRNNLSAEPLSRLFSLGADEIDLVAKHVPGKNKAERFRSVLLLKGIASYLGTGVAKIEHKSLRQAAIDYAADPGKNITTYIKNMSAEVSGSAATGYNLTPRGLMAAKEMIDRIIHPAASKKA